MLPSGVLKSRNELKMSCEVVPTDGSIWLRTVFRFEF